MLILLALFVLSLPWWLPGRVVALRLLVFERVNGEETLNVPVDRFREVYSHPAASGRSRGAALSDLFWYWLSPGADLHQEHLEPGERYDEVAAATRGFLAVSKTEIEALAARCARRAAPTYRLRDLAMPIWAEFSYELVFGEECPPEARALITANADDVVTALKCTGLRHMDRRDRLTAYLETRLDDVRQPLPGGLTRHEQALYLQGVFFNTAVVQMAEATAHIGMVLAHHRETQARARTGDDRFLDQVINETFRLYPLFGVAHRITRGDMPDIPEGSVLCFNYADFHRAGFPDPDRFDPARFEHGVRDLNHIPFGVAANRPCPAWRLSPIALRAAFRELLSRWEFSSSARHTRSLPNRGPCLLTPAGSPPPAWRLRVMAVRDRWEDVWRSLVQLVLGAYMVWDARRQALCARHFGDR
ncbi:cytochrome P450 [Herbidospora daliensis]|uniref:cytochrome P450 n=1 Tax=Herbidospora daliensis TaxID=295585 RepID=UPI0007856667|nr:cytochrome P450 [Herbidospora daliensis]